MTEQEFNEVIEELEECSIYDDFKNIPANCVSHIEDFIDDLNTAIDTLNIPHECEIYFKWSASADKYQDYEKDNWDEFGSRLISEYIYLVVRKSGEKGKILHKWCMDDVLCDYFNMGDARVKLYAWLKNLETENIIEKL